MNSEHLAVRFGKGEVYEGYPTTRLVLDELPEDLTGIDLPEGPWEKQSLALPSPKESAELAEAGYEIDSLGRPIHPWFREMVTNPEIGVVTGNGFYHNWGPNYTADPIVITTEKRPRVLLITRKDTQDLAFPGGFVDKGEDDRIGSALRELVEETKLTLTEPDFLVYKGVVADIRATANSWPETSAYLFSVDTDLPVKAGSDAKKAEWYYIDELGDDLFGSHRAMLDMALEMRAKANQRTIHEILSAPEDEREVMKVDAGHMAYKHYHLRHKDDLLFCKEHDASRFTDPKREANSLEYLKKELEVCTGISKEGFKHIPARIALVNGTLLAMDSYHPEAGWQWRAPTSLPEFTQYSNSILAVLDELQNVKPLRNTAYERVIAPSYPTFWREGWDAIDDQVAESILLKMSTLTASWTNEQKAEATQLATAFQELRQVSLTLDRSPPLFMAHNDARQSNIAYHPQYGVRLVDWSWADPAPANADQTMLLIDLAKSGHDVTPWLEHFNREYAVTLIGMWLAHSTWETRDGSTTVREHQVASAVTAFQLLQQYQG